MLQGVLEYIESLIVVDSLTDDKLANMTLFHDEEKISYCSPMVIYDLQDKQKMGWRKIFEIKAEPDFTISFVGLYNKWDGPFEKSLFRYAKVHKGYMNIFHDQQAKKNLFTFNFDNIEIFKIFFLAYVWSCF